MIVVYYSKSKHCQSFLKQLQDQEIDKEQKFNYVCIDNFDAHDRSSMELLRGLKIYNVPALYTNGIVLEGKAAFNHFLFDLDNETNCEDEIEILKGSKVLERSKTCISENSDFYFFMTNISGINYDAISDPSYFKQTFKSRYLEFTYRLSTVKGFYYIIDYKYNGTEYKNNEITIGYNGYATLITYFFQSSPPTVPDVLTDLKNTISSKLAQNPANRANRITVLSWISAVDEQKIHLFCVVWIFHMFDKAIDTYGRNIMDFCLQVKKDVDQNGTEASLEGYLLYKLSNLISHSNFDYKIELPAMEYQKW